MKEFKFPSSSSSKVYTTLIQDNGLLSCDCPGWTVKKLNKVRDCKHCRKVAEDENLTLTERDGQWFVIGSGPTNPYRQKNVSGAASTEGVQSSPSPAHGDRMAAPPTSIKSTKEGVEVKAEPGFVAPMLASAMPEGKTADSYATADYVMEEKFDGHRIIIRQSPRVVTAWSRLGNVRTLPAHIIAAMGFLPEGMYDGELLVPGMHSYDVTAGQNSGTEVLVLFDMLETNKHSIMQVEQHVRRAFLQIAYGAIPNEWVGGKAPVQLAVQHKPSLARVQEIWARGGEGAIIKKLSAKYSPGWRSPDWIKVKAVANATLTIIGFVAGKNGPYSVVKLRDKDGIETTVKTLNNAMMREFAKTPNNYIGKRVVISYQEKLPSGSYRHPMLDHLVGVGE